MDEDELKNILKSHAEGFELKARHTSFDQVMQKRAALQREKRRKPFVWFLAASVIGVCGITIALKNNQVKENTIEKNIVKNEQGLLSNKETISESLNQVETLETTTRLHHKNGKPGHLKDDKITFSGYSDHTILSSQATKMTPAPSGEKIPTYLPNAGGASSTTLIKQIKQQDMQLSAISGTQTDPKQPVLPVVENIQAALSNKETAPAEKTDAGSIAAKPEPVALNADTVIKNTAQPAFVKELKDTVITVLVKDSPIVSNNVPGNHAPYNWSVSGIFTPQLFNSIYNANSDATLKWMKMYIANREKNDKALYSFNAGVKLERRINKHFSVSAGALYSVVKFEEIRIIHTPVMVDTIRNAEGNPLVGTGPAGAFVTLNKVERNSFDISFSSLEIPLQLYYTFQHKKMFYQATAGISYSYLFRTRSLVFDVNDSMNSQETNDAANNRLQQHSFLLVGGGNVGYQISKHLSCYAGPVFRYSLNSIYSKDYIIKQQPYFVGLETGIKFSF